MVCSIGRARVRQDDNVKRDTENVEQRVALIRDGFPTSCAHLKDAQLYRSAFERRSTADTRIGQLLHLSCRTTKISTTCMFFLFLCCCCCCFVVVVVVVVVVVDLGCQIFVVFFVKNQPALDLNRLSIWKKKKKLVRTFG